MATASPSFLIQRDNVTSVIDSPTGGTLISIGAPPSACGGVEDAGPVSEAAACATAGVGAAAAAPPASILATTAPIGSVSPSLAIVFKVPACSAVSSKVALSDSN